MLSRSGASRTLNLPLWRRLLCQLSYAPVGFRMADSVGHVRNVPRLARCKRAPQNPPSETLFLPRFLVHGVLAFLPAELFQLEPVGAARLLVGPVVASTANSAFQPDVFPHEITSEVRGQVP